MAKEEGVPRMNEEILKLLRDYIDCSLVKCLSFKDVEFQFNIELQIQFGSGLYDPCERKVMSLRDSGSTCSDDGRSRLISVRDLAVELNDHVKLHSYMLV